VQKTILIAAGEAVLGSRRRFHTRRIYRLFFSGIAAIVVFVMLRANLEKHAWIGIVGFTFLSLFTIFTLFPLYIRLPSMFSDQ
jgi:hypothetical protein